MRRAPDSQVLGVSAGRVTKPELTPRVLILGRGGHFWKRRAKSPHIAIQTRSLKRGMCELVMIRNLQRALLESLTSGNNAFEPSH